MTDASHSSYTMVEFDPTSWLAAIVESSDDAIVGKTLDGTVRSWNASAQRVFGYHSGEILGRSVLQLIPPELQDEEPAIVARLQRGERVEPFETVRMRRDGTRIDVSISVSPIRNRAGTIVGAAKIARDITESKRLLRAERELAVQLQELASELEQQVEEGQALQEELEQSNEELGRSLAETESARRDAEEANAAKGRFLTTMSHELRTPLNAIAGYVDLLEQGIRGPLTNDQRHDIARIRRNEGMLLRLIEDVLTFAKLESGRLHYHYEVVRIGDILETLEAFITPRLAQKGLAYRVEPGNDNVMVTIDRAKVEQIMVNLLSNATKFTETGYIEVRCTVHERDIALHVTDTGAGIHPDLLEVVFDPFVQADSSLTRTAEGTGLGLSISRDLARAMRGEITVISTLGKGSTFTLTLPRS